MLAENFRTNVCHMLDTLGWTRTQLADGIGKTRQYVTCYLNGHRDPGLVVVEEFAEALGVPAQRLLETPKKVKTIA